MLNEKENINKITTRCINCLPIVYLVCSQDNGGISVIMAPITEEQEKQLDNEETIVIEDKRNNSSFTVNAKSCYAYGKLDLSPKSKDIELIHKADWFKNLYVNVFVFNEYDYDTHTITSDVVGGRWYETNNVKTYLPFLHAKLGKPERVVIFREELDLLSLRRKNKVKNSKLNRDHYTTCKDYYKGYNKRNAEIKRKNRISKLSFTIKKH